jgi:hypothetical protein
MWNQYVLNLRNAEYSRWRRSRLDEMEIRVVFGTLNTMSIICYGILQDAYQMSAIREGKERKDLGYLWIFKYFPSRVLDSRTNLKA